jgi:hypothetical protein
VIASPSCSMMAARSGDLFGDDTKDISAATSSLLSNLIARWCAVNDPPKPNIARRDKLVDSARWRLSLWHHSSITCRSPTLQAARGVRCNSVSGSRSRTQVLGDLAASYGNTCCVQLGARICYVVLSKRDLLRQKLRACEGRHCCIRLHLCVREEDRRHAAACKDYSNLIFASRDAYAWSSMCLIRLEPWFHHDVNTHASSHVHAWRSRHAGQVCNSALPTSSTSPVRVHGHLDSLARLQLVSPPTTSGIFHFGKAKCYFRFNIFTLQIFSSIVSDFPCLHDLRRPTLHALSVLPTPPLDMLRGLALPTRRSPDLRVQIFYLVLCSPPLDTLGGLAMPI